MGVIIIHKPPEADGEVVIDFNMESTELDRKLWLKTNKEAILTKVSDAIDRL